MEFRDLTYFLIIFSTQFSGSLFMVAFRIISFPIFAFIGVSSGSIASPSLDIANSLESLKSVIGSI